MNGKTGIGLIMETSFDEYYKSFDHDLGPLYLSKVAPLGSFKDSFLVSYIIESLMIYRLSKQSKFSISIFKIEISF